jgi:hypothetical protein
LPPPLPARFNAAAIPQHSAWRITMTLDDDARHVLAINRYFIEDMKPI